MSEEHPGPGPDRLSGQPGGAGAAASIRASDEDRERLIGELNEHSVAGRLSTEELEDRLESAYAARTVDELDGLRRDLPPTPRAMALTERARRRHLTRQVIQETGGSAGLFVICTIIWLVSSGGHGHGQFWPVWVLIVFVLSLARNGWALFGPAPDLDAVERDLESRRQQRLEHRQRQRDHHRHRR